MTRKQRNPTSSSKLYSDSSAANSPISRHRRRTKPYRTTGDYTNDDSQTQSRFSTYDSKEDGSEQQVTDGYDTSYITRSGSVFVDNSPPEPFHRSRSFKSTVLRCPNSAPSSRGINSYVNVAPLPVFRGSSGECPVKHLSRFAKVCRANNAASVEMMILIFAVTLEDEAALWYDLNIEPYITSLSWEQIKSSFVEAYRTVEQPDQLRRELATNHHTQDEPVRSYFLRLQWILNRFPNHGLSDSLLRTIFTDGLSDDVRDWVISQKPQSLNEALSLAFGYERVKVKVKVKVETSGIDQMVYARSGGSGFESGGSEKGGEGEGRERRECRCSKHGCWKKGMERNRSAVSRNYSLVSRDSFTAE